ncbi:class I SAM-dependent methyltransferase [Paractinoplanes atraurantiacus]|uniref:Methyltransferase domain-containing protein n=1 Tax=Paractinoplanes atraurantiacus TaxID=1036182 RepID=A0A285KLL5_9ACTN|nr:class I SAM-dependent methyltransferase [Actinoplanes atraurantiacus]SNY73542.1 Methyltransferase domain-containing protein [Actinoplanes atraurantiacus]
MTDTHIDEARVEAFAGQLLTDFAGAGTTALTVIGDRLGLYRAMTGAGPVTPAKLAAATGLHPRLVTEWLRAQAVSGYVTSDGETFELPIEHALALSVVDSPAYVVGGGDIIAGYFLALPQLEAAFRGDGGLPYADMPGCLHHGIERFFRTAYVNHLAQEWFPAVPGLVEKLEKGARVADVGCGHGVATRLIASTWPASTVTGFDNHEASIVNARAALAAGVDFHVAPASEIDRYGRFDVVAFFDSLHDLGDPPAALRAAYEALAPGGILIAVEPWSADDFTTVVGNPVARANYAASTALCTPGSLSQPGAYGLGTQGGPTARLELLAAAGFDAPVVAADTGFNLVLAGLKH